MLSAIPQPLRWLGARPLEGGFRIQGQWMQHAEVTHTAALRRGGAKNAAKKNLLYSRFFQTIVCPRGEACAR